MNGTITYLKSFLNDSNVASVTPSSKYCIRKLSEFIDFPSTKIIVEYGPGTGVFTTHFLKKLGKDARVYAFETNKLFYKKLQEIDDSRLILFNESVEKLPDLLPEEVMGNVDHIISGIPFSFFDWELKIKIMEQTNTALNESGSFLAYQTPGHLKEPLNHVFGTYNTALCWRNIPPYYIYEAFKRK